MTTTTLGALPSSLIALSSAVWAPIGKVRIARRPTELGDPHERVGRQAPQELRQRALEVATITRLQRHLHLVLGIRKLGVRAQEQQREVREEPVQVVSERSLTDRDEYVAQVNGLVAEPLADRLELLAEDLGHPRQDVHVPHQDRREPHRLA